LIWIIIFFFLSPFFLPLFGSPFSILHSSLSSFSNCSSVFPDFPLPFPAPSGLLLHSFSSSFSNCSSDLLSVPFFPPLEPFLPPFLPPFPFLPALEPFFDLVSV